MNAPVEPALTSRFAPGRWLRKNLSRPAGAVLFAILGTLGVDAGHRLGRSAVVDLGPTDAAFVHGFHDLERDGQDYFRWSSVPSSTVTVPVRFCGPGVLRLRARRHFVDPAFLTVSLSGAVLGQRVVRARTDHPYKIIEFPVSKTICNSNVSVLLETSVSNARPLGVAIDWIEIRSDAGFRALSATLLRAAALIGLSTIAMGLLGAPAFLTTTMVVLLSALMGLSFAAAPVAAERILRGGTAAFALTLAVGFLIGRFSGIAPVSRRARIFLLGATLLTLISRAAFLHPQAFYPDYRVHALVQQTLGRGGLRAFLNDLFEIQYARSLGLQQVEGRWYPFPYPPGSYVVTQWVGAVFGLDALDASQVTAVTAASLIPLLSVAIGIAIGAGEVASVAGALFVALQPLLVRRMALGYYPGVAGQFADAFALLVLVSVLRSPKAPARRFGLLAASLLAAFLVYTQSVANFGLLVAVLLLLELARRSVQAPATLKVALAAGVALFFSVGSFYFRYIPVMVNVSEKRPQPESVVLDRLERVRSATAEEGREEDSQDPYVGSTISPWRGLARLGSRLWRFNGPFALAIGLGCFLLWRTLDRGGQNLLLAWAGVAVWISLLSAGLPSPNGFQHLKDLEFVAPLGALAVGTLAARLWSASPPASVALAVSWLVFSMRAFSVEFADRLQRLSGF